MDKDITHIISNEDWTVTYQVPMKLASSEEDESATLNLKVKLDFQRFNSERIAIVFSYKDQCAGKWLLQEHFQNKSFFQK